LSQTAGPIVASGNLSLSTRSSDGGSAVPTETSCLFIGDDGTVHVGAFIRTFKCGRGAKACRC